MPSYICREKLRIGWQNSRQYQNVSDYVTPSDYVSVRSVKERFWRSPSSKHERDHECHYRILWWIFTAYFPGGVFELPCKIFVHRENCIRLSGEQYRRVCRVKILNPFSLRYRLRPSVSFRFICLSDVHTMNIIWPRDGWKGYYFKIRVRDGV